ncbi:MAG: acyltransferase [Psychrobacillus sp.]
MLNILQKIKFKFSLMSPKDRAIYLKKYSELTIGDNCEIHGDVIFGSEPYLIKIGNHVRLTHGVKFITHDGAMWVIRNIGWSPNGGKVGPITIGDNVMIGQDTIIMPNIEIGSNVVIGAGSVVTKNIPDNSIYAGIPAKYICTLEDYFDKNLKNIEETKQMTSYERKLFYKSKYKI